MRRSLKQSLLLGLSYPPLIALVRQPPELLVEALRLGAPDGIAWMLSFDARTAHRAQLELESIHDQSRGLMVDMD